jgi:hypothetical protein
VPPNATATLLLPVANGQQVYESNKQLDPASPYIRLEKSTPGLRQYHLAAGSYELAIR